MKRLILISVLGLFMASAGWAMRNVTVSSITTSGTQVVVLAPIQVAYITVSNSHSIAVNVGIYDSTTYKFTVALPSKDMIKIPLKCRFSTGLCASASDTGISISVAYESGAYGHYLYGVKNDIQNNTVYLSLIHI